MVCDVPPTNRCGASMIVLRVNPGPVTVMGLSREDWVAIGPYAKYTTYMLEKFSGLSRTGTRFTEIRDFLTATDIQVRRQFAIPVASRWTSWAATYVAHSTEMEIVPIRFTHNIDISAVIALTREQTQLLPGNIDWAEMCRRLRGRLGKTTFPEPELFVMFMCGLAGKFITPVPTTNPAYQEYHEFQNYPWVIQFSKLFTPTPNLTEWYARVEEVLGVFAKDRRTTTDKICTMLKVKK